MMPSIEPTTLPRRALGKMRLNSGHVGISLIGPPTHLYRHYRLDADGIALEAREFIEGQRVG